MKILFKAIAIVFAFLFAWVVYLQNNDPNASTWYVIYVLTAIASILFALNGLTLTLAVFYVSYLW